MMSVIPSGFEIPLFVFRNIKTNIVPISKTGKANFKKIDFHICGAYGSATSYPNKAINILPPTILPTDIPGYLRIAAPIDTVNSGKLVPGPIITMPIQDSATSHFSDTIELRQPWSVTIPATAPKMTGKFGLQPSPDAKWMVFIISYLHLILNKCNLIQLNKFFEKFKLNAEKEELQTVITNIDNGVVFRGTNLWILIFAIFVASLGLNVNSTAVIIGAMLISPLMGPIMGIGLGMGINDITLLRKAIFNYFIATCVALSTSTIFFLLSPLSDAHSEILARTSPTIYDVLIALFGGFAGILATSSKQKGNVIPGVAIATALMPPLCTAGYGLATLQFSFFIGAFYLFVINTVFIALATFIFVRFLHFPHKHFQNKRADQIAQRIVWFVVTVTLLPSIYFGYDIVLQDRFTKNANRFITYEAHFPNDYLLNKKIDAKGKKISLVFGGKEISTMEIEGLKAALKKYNLDDASLDVKQGFAYLTESKYPEESDAVGQLQQALILQQENGKNLQFKIDSIRSQETLSTQLFAEIKAQYPNLKTAIIQPVRLMGDKATIKNTVLVYLTLSAKIPLQEKRKIENWLKVRLNQQNVQLIFQQ